MTIRNPCSKCGNRGANSKRTWGFICRGKKADGTKAYHLRVLVGSDIETGLFGCGYFVPAKGIRLTTKQLRELSKR